MTQKRTASAIILRARELRHNQTPAETLLWSFLRSRRSERLGFRRQHPIGRYIVDFCCPRKMLVIELDGGPHRKQHEADAARTADLETMGYRVLRFWNDEVMNDIYTVMKTIMEAME